MINLMLTILIHGRFRGNAGSETAPGAVELPDDVDLDYFDRHDLGRLRRRLRTAVQRFRRERELYLELVLSYIDVRDTSTYTPPIPPLRSLLSHPPPPPIPRSHALPTTMQWV